MLGSVDDKSVMNVICNIPIGIEERSNDVMHKKFKQFSLLDNTSDRRPLSRDAEQDHHHTDEQIQAMIAFRNQVKSV